MDRASVYFINKHDKNKTYDFDEKLPALPLPTLRDTLARYYESVKPFGNPEELAHTRAVISKFENGIGAELHAKLEERAAKMKNWLGSWWEDYGYLLSRIPLLPYQLMSMVGQLECVGVPETPEMALKNIARQAYHSLEFWKLMHTATIKPLTSNNGKIKYSSALYKRFYSTTRVPGVEKDIIEKHFRIIDEGPTPTHIMVTGKGRQFIFNCVHDNGDLLTPQELLVTFQRIRSILDYEPLGDCVAMLTHDNRTTWANNRMHLIEISKENQNILKLIESSVLDICFDEHEPKDYEEVAQISLYGDYHSRWAGRSSSMLVYKTGKFSWTGEHSCYDGTVSISFAIFMHLSLLECPEPNWNEAEYTKVVPLQELKFDLDNHLKAEIERMQVEITERGHDVVVTFEIFKDYGKNFMKQYGLHPDSFVQVIMQWAYLQMHNEIASTYETALMRQYYNGRTETLRSCTTKVHEFLKVTRNNTVSKETVISAFRAAVIDHKYMMDEARKGHGIDRHLFGLWCVAYENHWDIPEFYDDPLYTKSGGGANFSLSTSTLGFTSNVGFVAPMIIDGYSVFYSITTNSIYINTTAYRDSIKTDARKFNGVFIETFRQIRRLLEENQTSKL